MFSDRANLVSTLCDTLGNYFDLTVATDWETHTRTAAARWDGGDDIRVAAESCLRHRILFPHYSVRHNNEKSMSVPFLAKFVIPKLSHDRLKDAIYHFGGFRWSRRFDISRNWKQTAMSMVYAFSVAEQLLIFLSSAAAHVVKHPRHRHNRKHIP